MVAVALIDTDGKNLRRENGDVSGLRSSFESLGMLQPLTLRPMPGGRYELVAGHRRLSAALQSGALAVPAIVREMDERQKWEARLGENLHRRDLTPSELSTIASDATFGSRKKRAVASATRPLPFGHGVGISLVTRQSLTTVVSDATMLW